MSDFAGLVVISFLGMTGFLINYYIGNSASNLGAQVLTGAIRGTPGYDVLNVTMPQICQYIVKLDPTRLKGG